MKPLSALTIKRARWLRDLCRDCPVAYNLDAVITDTDCAMLAEALDFAIRMSARQWTPATPKQDLAFSERGRGANATISRHKRGIK